MKKLLYILTIITTFSSCNYLDVKPVGKVIPGEVSEFRALMTSAYSKYPNYRQLLTVRGDEVLPSAFGLSFNTYFAISLWDDVTGDPLTLTYPWTDMYNIIFYTNSVIADVMNAGQDSHADTPAQLKAEALLLRAYVHFELLNLYATPYDAVSAATDRGIPLSLKTDIGQAYKPESVEAVYTQILADIEEGKKQIEVEEQPAATRYRFSMKSAKALEARVRLYRGEWEKALAAAEELLPSCPLENLTEPAFKAPYDYTSKESILALQLGGKDIVDDMDMAADFMQNYNTEKQSDGTYKDCRVALYFKYASVPNKGGVKNERVTFRSAEIYLIAAEAAAHLPGKQNLAKERLKTLLVHRLQNDYYTTRAREIDLLNDEELITEILDERAREFALEGQRWYDLRRTTRPEIRKTIYDMDFNEHSATLKKDDPRYIIPFPKEATTHNPNLAN